MMLIFSLASAVQNLANPCWHTMPSLDQSHAASYALESECIRTVLSHVVVDMWNLHSPPAIPLLHVSAPQG